MNKVNTCALPTAALAAMTIAGCGAGGSGSGSGGGTSCAAAGEVWDAGSAPTASGSGSGGATSNEPTTACSTDGSDSIVKGLYEETFSSTPPLVEMFVGAPTCGFCSDGSGTEDILSDLKWRSAYSADKKWIVVTLVAPDGGTDTDSWVSLDGSAFYVGNPSDPSVFTRAHDASLTCSGAPTN